MYRFLSVVFVALWAMVLNAQTHWTFNYRLYKNDMTAFFALQRNGTAVSDMEGYEVAAFVGEECRGIATMEQVEIEEQNRQYGYLRIYSNLTDEESVTFKAYQKSSGKELTIKESVTFDSSQAIGYPSSPLVLNMIEKGDANGDGVINIADVTAIINHINGSTSGSFVLSAADANGDGSINIADVTAVINMINQ